MKKTVCSRLCSLLLALSLVLSAGILVPGTVKAASDHDLQFAVADKSVHLLYWARGIKPPKLPENFDSKAPLAISFDPEGKWYDLNLPEVAVQDGAAAAANLLHWWLGINQTNIDRYLKKEPAQPDNYREQLAAPQDLTQYTQAPQSQKTEDSPIYNLFRMMGGDGAYEPDTFLDFFLNGYPMGIHQNSPDAFSPQGGHGGFLFPVFDVVPVTNRIDQFEDYGKLGTLLRRTLQENCGMIIGMSNAAGETSYANIWGAEYGEDKKLTALYITESLGGTGDSSMIRCRIGQTEDGSIRISSMKDPTADGLKLETIYMLYSGAPNFATFLGGRVPNVEYPDQEYLNGAPSAPGTEEPDWNAATYQWSEDLMTCTAIRTDKTDESKVEKLEVQAVVEQTQAPTQDKAGLRTFVASFPKPWAETQTRTREIPALKDHQWTATQYAWNEDFTRCAAKRTSAQDETIEQIVEAKVTASVSKAPTEKEKGETTYIAQFKEPWAKTQTKTVADIPVAAPAWNEPEYHWSQDYSQCKAVRSRKGDSSVAETAMASVTSSVSRKPTQTQKGETTYTAKFREDWAKPQRKTVENIPAAVPAWNAPEYHWSQDYSQCKAVRSRKDDSSITETAMASVSSSVSRKPTETQKGETTYTAKFKEDWAKPQRKTVEDIPVVVPTWNAPEYYWAQDYSQCKAVRSRKDDSSITETVLATVTSAVTREATETQKGETTYTAKFKEDWARPQKKTVENIPAKGSVWGEPEYHWSQDYKQCKAVRVSKSDKSITQTAVAKVTYAETKAPTAAEKGETTYTAVFSESWASTQEKTVADVPALGGQWSEPEYRWSKDYRQCQARRVSRDDPSITQTAVAEVTYYQTKAPTETRKGETTYTAEFKEAWAQTQEKTVADIPMLNTIWGEPTYTWSKDHRHCTAKRISTTDSKLQETATAVKVTYSQTKAPTATQKGETTYVAAFREDWAKDQRKTVADIPMLSGGSAPTEDSGWKEPTYEWSNDHSRCTASRAKKNDPSNVVMAQGRVEVKEVRPATCQTPGESIYTAKFTEPWAKTQQATVEVKDGMHDLEQVPQVEATGTTAGMKAHYQCKLCKKLFADPEGTVEVTREDLLIEKPAMVGDNAVVQAIPEKENTVAITGALLSSALENYPEAKGLLVNVGDASVVYSRETAEKILKDHKDARKLVLQVVKTDFGSGSLTTDQALAVQRNTAGTLYQVSLMNGKEPVSAPCTVMLPYSPMGEGQTGVYLVAGDGSFQKVTSQLSGKYLAFNADTGFFMASETEPEAPKAKSKAGLIVWIVVLVISGLLFLGGGGFLLYRKIQEDRDDEFDSEPQFDQAAVDRIRAPRPRKPQAPQAQDMPAYRQPQAQDMPVYVQPQAPAAPEEPTQAFTPVQEPAAPQEHPEPRPQKQPHLPPKPYHGAFEKRSQEKPSLADKAVKAAHQNQPQQPQAQPEDPARAQEENLKDLKDWLEKPENQN